MFCTNCGMKMPDGSRFCTNCGAPMTASDTQAAGGENAEKPDTVDAVQAAEETASEESGRTEPAEEPAGACEAEAGAAEPDPIPAAQTGETADPLQGADQGGQWQQTYGAQYDQPQQQTYGAQYDQPQQQAYGAQYDQPQQAYGAQYDQSQQQAYGAQYGQPQQAYGAQYGQPQQPYGTPRPSFIDRLTAFAKKNPIICGGIGAAAVIAIALIVFFVNYNSPKNTVLRSIRNTANAIVKEDTGIGEYLGWNSLLKNLTQGKTRQVLAGEVDMDDLDMGVSGSLGLSMTIDSDAGKEAMVNLDLIVSDMNMKLANAYYDKNMLLVSIPKLYSQSLLLDWEQMEEMVDNGQFFDVMEDTYDWYMDSDEKEAVEDFFRKDNTSAELSEKYQDYSEKVWKALYRNMEVEKEGSRKYTIGGNDRRCTGYEVTIQREDIVDVMDNFLDFVDEEMVEYLAAATVTNPVALRDDIEDVRRELDDAIEDDLLFTVYVGPGSRMVAAEWEGEEGEGLSLELLGEKNPLDNMSFSADDDGEIILEIYRDVEDKSSGTMTDNIGLTAGYTNLAATLELDKNKGDWELVLDYSDYWSADEISFSGVFENVSKGKNFTMTCDRIRSSGERMDVNLSYSVSQIKNVDSKEITSMDRLNLLEADQRDFEDMADEMESNMEDFIYEIADGLDMSYEDLMYMLWYLF